MRDDLSRAEAGAGEGGVDPFAMARRDLKKALPRRFWTTTGVGAREGGFGIDLDGRPARTPGQALIVVPNRALAEALVAEWDAQTAEIDPQAMPLTRIVGTAIDGDATSVAAMVDQAAKFAQTDLVCYRAAGPEALVAAQAAAWDPILAFAATELGARFVCAEGVMYQAQPEGAEEAVRAATANLAAGPAGALRVTAFGLMTSLLGSVLLAHAVVRGQLTVEAAWAAAHVDEDHQMAFWGADAEALARRDARGREMAAAAMVFRLLEGV